MGAVSSIVAFPVAQTLTSVVIQPGDLTVSPGATRQFMATGNDQFGKVLSSQPVFAWSLNGGGTISPNGLFTAPASGTSIVQASAAGKTGLVEVTVSTLPPGIFYDSLTGAMTVRTNAYNNFFNISSITINGVQWATATLTSTDSLGNTVLGQSRSDIPLSQINHIYFYGQAGFNNIFENLTAVPCTAYAGSGANALQGGSGNDELYGGPGTNSLRGMDGDDLLVGGTGTNYLYGGTGNNTLTPGPGPGPNYLFPNG